MVYLELFTAVIVTLAFAVYYVNRIINKRYIQNLKGPPPLLVFGNTLDFLFQPTTSYFTVLQEYTRKYGRIVKVHDSPLNQLVVTTDYKLIEYLLNSTKMIEKSNQYDHLRRWLGTGLLTSQGIKWKKHRRIVTPSFHFAILAHFIDIFETVGNTFIEKLNKEVGKPSENIYPLVSLCTLDIIYESAMGISVNAQLDGESEYVQSVKQLLSIVVDRTVSPIHKWLYPFTPNFYKENKALKVLHSYTNRIIDNKIKDLSSKCSTDSSQGEKMEDVYSKKRLAFLDLLLESSIDGRPLSRTELREEVDTIMFGGHDTTASAISFALYLLSTNPAIQRNVLDEQRRIFGNVKCPVVTLSDLQDMKYLELVLKETLRLYPSVPIFGRKVSEDFMWDDGSIFPKGLNILFFIYGMQRDPEYFQDPDEFIPERFENYSGKDPFSYIPFGAGPRNCIGQKFAALEMKSIISKVVRHFELLPANPEHVLQLAPETILVSKNGIYMSMRKRQYESEVN